jgi:hypothetical protein
VVGGGLLVARASGGQRLGLQLAEPRARRTVAAQVATRAVSQHVTSCCNAGRVAVQRGLCCSTSCRVATWAVLQHATSRCNVGRGAASQCVESGQRSPPRAGGMGTARARACVCAVICHVCCAALCCVALRMRDIPASTVIFPLRLGARRCTADHFRPSECALCASRVALRCNVLRTCCAALQRVATCCAALQRAADLLRCVATCCDMLRCVATCSGPVARACAALPSSPSRAAPSSSSSPTASQPDPTGGIAGVLTARVPGRGIDGVLTVPTVPE